MARELKPCGTRAAAQRHRRAGEEVCADCKEAERQHRRKHARRDRTEKTVHVDFGSSDTTDPLQIARENLQVVTDTLRSDKCLPKDIVPLTRRREELAELISQIKKREEEDAEDGEIGEDEEWDADAV